jgi:hypothetical protein
LGIVCTTYKNGDDWGIMIVLPTLHDIDFLSGTSGENCLKVFFCVLSVKEKSWGRLKSLERDFWAVLELGMVTSCPALNWGFGRLLCTKS